MLRRTLAVGLSVAIITLGLIGTQSAASAASSDCPTGDSYIAGQEVAVTDLTGTYAAACARITTAPKLTYAGGNWTTTYSTIQKDTAHDDQYAVTLVRLVWYDGGVSSWIVARTPTGTESWSQAPVDGKYVTKSAPAAIQFTACRSTSATGFPSNSCAFRKNIALALPNT